MDGNEMDAIVKQEYDSDSNEDTNNSDDFNLKTNTNENWDEIKAEADSDRDEDIQQDAYFSSHNESEGLEHDRNWVPSKQLTSQQARFKSFDEIIKMLVIPIIKEATVLKTDPRHYFPFYTSTSKAINAAIKLNLIHHDEINDSWVKCDELAVSVFEAGVIDESYKVVTKKTRRKRQRYGGVKQKPCSNFSQMKLWHELLDLLKQCRANNTSRLDLDVRRDFFLRLSPEVEKQSVTKFKEEFYFAFFTSSVEQLEEKLKKSQIQKANENTNIKTQKTAKERSKKLLTLEERRERRKQYNYFYRQAIKSTLAPEQLEEIRKAARERSALRYISQSQEMKQIRNEKFKAWESKLTGEKRKRHKANQSKAALKWQHKFKVTQPEKYQQKLEKINQIGRERIKNETSEQRQKRLLRLRVTSMKHNLVSKLKKEGMGPEDIEKTVEERLVSIIEQCKERMNAKDLTYIPRLKQKKAEPSPPANIVSTKPQYILPPGIPSQVTNAVSFNAPCNVNDGPNPNTPMPEYKAVYRVYKNQVVPWKGKQRKIDSSVTCPLTNDSIVQNTDCVPNAGPTSLPTLVISETPQIEQSCVSNPSIDNASAVESFPIIFEDAICTQNSDPLSSLNIQLIEIEISQNETDNNQLDLINIPSAKVKPEDSDEKTVNTDTDERVICDVCGKLLKLTSIYSHKNNFHNPSKSTSKCPKCTMKFPNARLLWHHIIAVHNTEDGTQPPKGKTKKNTNKKSWVRYPENVGDEDETEPSKQYRGPCVVCDQCGKKYSQKANLDDHIRRVHMGQKYICSVCGVEQQSAGKLWKHKIDRHGIREEVPPGVKEVISCEHCGIDVLRSYPTHLKKYHPEKLEEYLIQHPPGKRHRFYNKNLPNNSPSPTKNTCFQKLIECYVCFKKIGDRSLARHLRNVHGMNTKSFACDQCDKTFNEHYRLMEHIRMTHLIKDLDRKLVTLNLIKYTKDGNKYVYACNLCNHSIESRNDMRSHILTDHINVFEQMKNSKDPVWICRLCSNGFETEKEFVEHLKSVHPSKEFFCPQPTCLQLFNTAIQLKEHLTQDHPERSGPMYFKTKCSSQGVNDYGHEKQKIESKKGERRPAKSENHDLSNDNDKKQLDRRNQIKVIYKDESESEDKDIDHEASIDTDSDFDGLQICETEQNLSDDEG